MKTNLKVSLENIIPLTEARDHFSQIVAEVQRDKLYVLTKGGKPAVAIIDVKYLERITGGQVKPEQVEAEIQKDPAKVGRPVMFNHSQMQPNQPPKGNSNNQPFSKPNFSNQQNTSRQPFVANQATQHKPIAPQTPPAQKPIIETKPQDTPQATPVQINPKPIDPPKIAPTFTPPITPPATPPTTSPTPNPWNNLNNPTTTNTQTAPNTDKPIPPQNPVGTETVFKPNPVSQTPAQPAQTDSQPINPPSETPDTTPTTSANTPTQSTQSTQSAPATTPPVNTSTQPQKPSATTQNSGAFIDVIAAPDETETTPKVATDSDDKPGPAQYSGEDSKNDVEDMALD